MSKPSFPLHYVIYQYLKMKKESSIKDLIQALKAFGYENVDESEVLRVLMRLELNGLVAVSTDKKYKYYIKLRQ
jgi:DNA-binding PadR family transcriptional regulator